MKSPAFQFYANDWLSSVAVMLMTPDEEGAYIRLLAIDWSSDGILDDDDTLASLSRLGEGWLKGSSTKIRKCFIQHPTKSGYVTNPRLQEEREKQEKWRQKCALGGAHSAESRSKSKSNNESKGSSSTLPRVVQVNGNSSSSSSSISKDKSHTHTGDRVIPSWPTVKKQAEFIGLPEWKAKDWFDEMETCRWIDSKNREVANWQSFLDRVKGWWEGDGRPMERPNKSQKQGGNYGNFGKNNVTHSATTTEQHAKGF